MTSKNRGDSNDIVQGEHGVFILLLIVWYVKRLPKVGCRLAGDDWRNERQSRSRRAHEVKYSSHKLKTCNSMDSEKRAFARKKWKDI